jgi:hypothetical protein
MEDNRYWAFCMVEFFNADKCYINNMCSGSLPPSKTIQEVFNKFGSLGDYQNRKYIFVNFEIPDDDLEKVLKLEDDPGDSTIKVIQAFEVSRIFPCDDLDPMINIPTNLDSYFTTD